MNARPTAVEIEQPRTSRGEFGDESILPDGFPEALMDGVTCQAVECCSEPAATVGYDEMSWEDSYGREHEGYGWRNAFRLPDGRIVCEDCALTFDENGLV